MLWDLIILATAIGLGVSGWNTGLINSWRGPLAIVLATIITQHLYVDAATWFVQQLLLSPQNAAFFGYLIVWIVSEICLELVLQLFLNWHRRARPNIIDRFGGFILGISKCAIIVVLPLIAMSAPAKIPAPPAGSSEDSMSAPFKLAFEESSMIKMASTIGSNLKPTVESFVLSDKEPSFKPTFKSVQPLEKPSVHLNLDF
ncbi:MAG: CvpA family protein [Candidatus Obscuribacterales bacterium]|nr:CvpA family protein [Candidatus Obscuribacterales bacterium]